MVWVTRNRVVGFSVLACFLGWWLLSVFAPVFSARAAETSLQGSWNFAEGKGDVLHDGSGNNNDGKIQGATWVNIFDGYALQFDGQDDSVTLPPNPSFYNLFGTAWTVEAWVKPSTITSGIKVIFDKPYLKHSVPYYQIQLGLQLDNGGNKDYGVIIARPTDGAVSFGAYGPGNSAVAGEWAHLVATFDTNTRTLVLYKNGVQIAQDDTPSDPTAAYGNYQTGAALGCMLNTLSSSFSGAITGVRIYNRGFSEDKVKEQYNERAEKFGLKKIVLAKTEEDGGESGGGQEEAYVMPYDVDPPITVDGDLADWDNVPNAIVLNKKEQVTYGPQTWTGPADLSGIIRLAWRDGIYIAAEVTDDIVQQPYSGAGIYAGDHINLWLDLKPAFEPGRDLFGEGQYHIAVSPGNFGGGANAGKVIPPEIFIYAPEGLPQEGGKVVSRRTDKGYVIEAFIPFSRLKIEPPKRDQYAAFEVAIGDSDSTPAKQETFITYGTKPWKYLRSRLIPMIFGSGSGQAASSSRTFPIAKTINIQKKAKETIKFTMGALDPASEPFLFFRGRMDNKNVAGYADGVLTMDLNGERIRGERLSNRGLTATMEDNRDLLVASADGRILLPAAPDFTSTDKNRTGYALQGGVKAAEYEFYVGGLLKEGENTLTFSHLSDHPLHSFLSLGDLQIRTRPPAPGSKFLKSASTGELSVCEPQTSFPKMYSALKQNNNKISLAVGKDTYSLESRFSTPDGEWQTGSNKFFSHQRKVIEHEEWIEVRDTFRNLTQDNLPLIQEHKCVFEKEAQGVWFAGIKKPFKTGRVSGPTVFENGTVFATTSESGIGLVPRNDEFMVHVELAADQGKWVQIGDPLFVLKKGAEYTAEWAIVPVPKPDYYTFVNAARRLTDANFTLNWMSAFVQLRGPVYDWSDSTLKEFIDNKSANLLVQSNEVYYDPNYEEAAERIFGKAYRDKYGKYISPRSTSFLMYPSDRYLKFQERLKKLYPDGSKKTTVYFHWFLDTHEPNNERFASDRALDANGNHINYGVEYLKEFVSTLENGWGKENAKVIDKILDEIGSGLYIDEFPFSRADYVYNMWDGCSAEIDPVTHKIIRTKGSVPLLSRDYRAYYVKRILDRGAPLITNGQPVTRTLRRLKFEAFVETGSGLSNCMRTQLYSPVVLGDHLTEDSYKEIYQNMVTGLDYGCLYAYYYSGRSMPNKTLTEYMYPFTPIELHEGYVIGRERILTNRSGLFGWADNSDFQAHVYDRDSKETDGSEVKKVQRDGKTYAEVRIPAGYSAAIVRVMK